MITYVEIGGGVGEGDDLICNGETIGVSRIRGQSRVHLPIGAVATKVINPTKKLDY